MSRKSRYWNIEFWSFIRLDIGVSECKSKISEFQSDVNQRTRVSEMSKSEFWSFWNFRELKKQSIKRVDWVSGKIRGFK